MIDHTDNEPTNSEAAAPSYDLSIPLPEEAPLDEVLAHDEAALRPRPFTYRDSLSGVVVTLN